MNRLLNFSIIHNGILGAKIRLIAIKTDSQSDLSSYWLKTRVIHHESYTSTSDLEMSTCIAI